MAWCSTSTSEFGMNRGTRAEVGTAISFVNFTKPGQGWKNANERIVRSHAMKHVRRRQKAKQLLAQQEKNSMERAKEYQCPSCGDLAHKCSCESENSSAHEESLTDRSTEEVNGELEQGATKSLLLQPDSYSAPLPTRRLLSHIANLFGPLQASKSQKFVFWTKGVRTLMGMAFYHDFVMQAVLAWSATHLSKMTGDATLVHASFNHRSRALKGLQQAIENFSLENADGILAASIVMSWQAADAQSWATFITGKASVTQAIISGRYTSALIDETDRQPMGESAIDDTPLTLEAPCPQVAPPSSMLKYAIQSLQTLQSYVAQDPQLVKFVNDMLEFVQDYRRFCLASDRDKRLRQVEALRDLLFWAPVALIPRLNSDPAVMLVIAHLHALPLIISPVTSIYAAYFQGLNAPPIESFYDELSYKAITLSGRDQEKYEKALNLLVFPLMAVSNFKAGLRELLHKNDSPVEGAALVMTTHFGGNANKTVLQVLESFPVGLWYNFIEPD